MAALWSCALAGWSISFRPWASATSMRAEAPIAATWPWAPGDSERSAAVSNTENLMLDEPALMTRIGSRIRLETLLRRLADDRKLRASGDVPPGREIAPTRLTRGGVGGAADRDELALFVGDVDIDDPDQLAAPAYGRGDDQRGLDCGPDVIDPEVHRRQRPPQQHHQCVVANGVDDRGDRAAVPLTGAPAALEFRPHLGAHDDLLLLRLGREHRQVQGVDKRGMRQLLLQLFLGQRCLAHGVTTSLPKTCRCSSRASASGARSRENVSSITACKWPASTMWRSAVRSSRAQAFEPRIFNSKLQM